MAIVTTNKRQPRVLFIVFIVLSAPSAASNLVKRLLSPALLVLIDTFGHGAAGAKLGPDSLKNVSDYGNGDSITLTIEEAHFVPTVPNRTIFLKTVG